MDCLLHIGNLIDKESRQHLSKLLQDVFESGAKNHMSETVIVKALDVCREAFTVTTNVSNSTFNGYARRENDK